MVTDEQIKALCTEAMNAGDYAQASLCIKALAGEAGARRACEEAIANARAMDDSLSEDALRRIARAMDDPDNA